MIRVRICTSRCRCQSSCRRSRFSGLGTRFEKAIFQQQLPHKSGILAVGLCFLTRLVLITAASPIHTSNPNSASSRSNQRE